MKWDHIKWLFSIKNWIAAFISGIITSFVFIMPLEDWLYITYGFHFNRIIRFVLFLIIFEIIRNILDFLNNLIRKGLVR